jgi:hypothetical protein
MTVLKKYSGLLWGIPTALIVAGFAYNIVCASREDVSYRITRGEITAEARVEALERLDRYEGPQTDGTCVACVEFPPGKYVKHEIREIDLNWAEPIEGRVPVLKKGKYLVDLLKEARTAGCSDIPRHKKGSRFVDYGDLIDQYIQNRAKASVSRDGETVIV